MNFPNKKKGIKCMLTSESQKFIAKSLIGVGILSAAAGYQSVSAGHSNSYSTSTSPAGFDPFPSNGSVPDNGSDSNRFIIVNSATCSHVSGLVNWHMSSVPTVNLSQSNVRYIKSHANHSSHASHSNHCSCSRWM